MLVPGRMAIATVVHRNARQEIGGGRRPGWVYRIEARASHELSRFDGSSAVGRMPMAVFVEDWVASYGSAYLVAQDAAAVTSKGAR